MKGLLGIVLVVGGSLSYALERIDVNKKKLQEEANKALLKHSPADSLNESATLEVTDEENP